MDFGSTTDQGPIGAAVGWVQGTLLGSVATTAAIIAVASVGFLMLTGRIDVRRAVQVVFGCFILFGASSIAHGIMAGINGYGGQQVPGPRGRTSAPALLSANASQAVRSVRRRRRPDAVNGWQIVRSCGRLFQCLPCCLEALRDRR